MRNADTSREGPEAFARGVCDCRAAGRCETTRCRQGHGQLNPAALIACESVLDPILEQLTTVLEEHSANFAGAVAEALERLRSTAPMPA